MRKVGWNEYEIKFGIRNNRQIWKPQKSCSQYIYDINLKRLPNLPWMKKLRAWWTDPKPPFWVSKTHPRVHVGPGGPSCWAFHYVGSVVEGCDVDYWLAKYHFNYIIQIEWDSFSISFIERHLESAYWKFETLKINTLPLYGSSPDFTPIVGPCVKIEYLINNVSNSYALLIIFINNI